MVFAILASFSDFIFRISLKKYNTERIKRTEAIVKWIYAFLKNWKGCDYWMK